MRLSGWLRLWIFVSVLYLVLVIAFVVFTLPKSSTISHSSPFYDQMNPELIGNILDKTSADADPSERSALFKEARRRGLVVEVQMPNGHVLVFNSKIPRSEQESAAKAYWAVVEKAAGEERRKYIGEAFLWWTIPVLGVYALGWAVGWIYRGFRSK